MTLLLLDLSWECQNVCMNFVVTSSCEEVIMAQRITQKSLISSGTGLNFIGRKCQHLVALNLLLCGYTYVSLITEELDEVGFYFQLYMQVLSMEYRECDFDDEAVMFKYMTQNEHIQFIFR